MTTVETVRVKADTAKGSRIINKSDYDKDPKKYDLVKDVEQTRSRRSEAEQHLAEEDEARRRVQANRGVSGGGVVAGDLGGAKNPSGTFSEPTPSDIRYPDKDKTEFENNHGAFVRKSAAQMREDAGLEDKPGGLDPSKFEEEKRKEDEQRARNKREREGSVEASRFVPEPVPTDELESMTRDELKAHAETNGIDLGDAHLKADLIKAIKKHQKAQQKEAAERPAE